MVACRKSGLRKDLDGDEGLQLLLALHSGIISKNILKDYTHRILELKPRNAAWKASALPAVTITPSSYLATINFTFGIIVQLNQSKVSITYLVTCLIHDSLINEYNRL